MILPIRKKWLDMILRGEKLEDYRVIKQYWTVRIMHWLGVNKNTTFEQLYQVLKAHRFPITKPVILQNGYGKRAVQVEAICSLSIGIGREDWGALPGAEYYRFHIEKIRRK